MCLKLIVTIFSLFVVSSSYANCEDPVPNEYLVVTNDPEKILKYINSLKSITGNLNKVSQTSNQMIYDHRLPKVFLKGGTSSKVSLKNIDHSTLILNLSKNEVHKIKQFKDTVISNNCFVHITSFENPIHRPDENLNRSASVSLTESNPLIGNTNSDPLYDLQWGLKSVNLNLPEELVIPNYKTIVAISDTGFDLNHEDLQENLWVNSVELNGIDGVDDDNNGCIDDIHGCDVTQMNGSLSVNTYKSNLVDHGTHVAGIVGATTNNQMGVSGTGVHLDLMLIKAFASNRRTTAADLIKSIYYAVDNNADVLNCSWESGSLPTVVEFNAFEYARINNMIVVAAAGNSATYASKTSPAGLSNVITVGSHNSNLQLSTFSNFGNAVDILAPGGDGIERRNDSILSLGAYSKYIEKKGTSMAAPYITAAIANLKSIYPNLKRTEILNILLNSADVKSVQGFFDPKYKDSLKIINLGNAIRLADEYTNSIEPMSSFDYEPKVISKPSTQSHVDVSSDQYLFQSEAHGSGCSNSNFKTKATNSSWLLIFIPLLYLVIKKRTLK